MANWADDADMRINLSWGWVNFTYASYLASFMFARKEANIAVLESYQYVESTSIGGFGIPWFLTGPPDRDAGAGLLANTQNHNPPVADAYRTANTNNPVRFWNLVMSASHVEADSNAVAIALQWQWANNKNSVQQAQASYTSNSQFALPLAIFFLISGQRHNPEAMAGYRAMFRSAPAELVRQVFQFV